jgi:plastocyanin
MRRVLVLTTVLASILLTALPAHAVAQVTIEDFSFTPANLKVPQGTSVVWHYDNSGTSHHTSSQNGPLALWNTGNLTPGQTSAAVPIQAAGTYPYHCMVHPFMTGKVIVPLQISPLSGTTSTTFTITLSAASQAGFTMDVQKKVGTDAWKNWRTGVTTLSVTFKPTSTGSIRFRSRLHKTSNGATSGYSPVKAITVS